MSELQNVRLQGTRIGVVMTGSHCTIGKVIPQLWQMKKEGAEIFPIFSYVLDETDNRFYSVNELKQMIGEITDKEIINTIVGAEPIGPQKLLDIVAVLPATGNTIAKLANGIVDTPALMAIKAHMRNQRPVVIGVSTNDGLSINAKNIGLLLNMKNVFFVPFLQDDPLNKVNSLVANMEYVIDTILCALNGKQFQPILLGPG